MTKTKTKDHSARPTARQTLSSATKLKLWVESGGYCEFDGCPKFLYEDGLTLLSANTANIAHIVAATADGPRGEHPLSEQERNSFENLMLVCYEHHRLFDHEYVEEYPVHILREYKERHEERIRWVMSPTNHRKTTVIKMLARIGNESPTLSDKDIRQAIFPNYPADRRGVVIDLTNISPEKSSNHWETCAEVIREKLADVFAEPLVGDPVDHVSAFGLAPIPLLVLFGRCLGNKAPCDIYQKHRIGENWMWKHRGTEAKFRIRQVASGTAGNAAVVVLSLSGTIDLHQLPVDLTRDCSIYELTLDGQEPGLNFLNSLSDLTAFRLAYQQLLSRIRADNPAISEIYLFPAIPPAVAITCGRELLEKAHPTLHVYDFDKNKSNWSFALKVN